MQTFLLSLSKAYIRSYQGLSIECWIGIILNLVESILTGTFYFLSIYFVNKLQFSVAQAGIIISCYGIGAIAGGFLSGKLSDRFSAATVASCSLFIQGIAYLAFIKLTAIFSLVINTFVLGIATYGFITANHVWVLSLCGSRKEQKLKALNLLATASNLGLGISALLMGAFAFYGFSHLFLLIGILFFVLAFWLMLLDKPVVIIEIDAKESCVESNPKQSILILTLVWVFLMAQSYRN